MSENILEAIDALLRQPFCSTDQSVAQELEKWQQELVALRQRLLSVSDPSERLVLEETCLQVMAQIESRLAAANTNLFRVSPQVEYATFELANTITALTAANTLAVAKEHINHLLSTILQDVQRELHRILAEERSAIIEIIKTEISQLFRNVVDYNDYNDRELLTWLDAEIEKHPIDSPLADPQSKEVEQTLSSLVTENDRSYSLPDSQDLFAKALQDDLLEESSSESLVLSAQQELESLDLLLEDLFADDSLSHSLVKTYNSDELSFTPVSSHKAEDITTIDVEMIEDKLNDFADRVEISFTIPGTKKVASAPTLPPLSLEDINDSWFLGIDFADTCIRPSLSNLTTGRVYELKSIPQEITINDRVIRSYKSLLQLGLPYFSNNQWWPILKWSENETIPLVEFLQGIKQILQNFKRQASHPDLISVPLILQNLSGVVFGYPAQWDDAYIFNLREIILNCGFCQRPEQVMAVPQIMSPLLDRLHNFTPITEATLFIDGGVNTTELLLVKPVEGKPLTNDNLFYQTIDQGGKHLSEILIQELLLPQLPHPAPKRSLIELADKIKVHIDREDIWLDEWEGYKLSIGRSAYINRVCQPFLQLLNRHINGLLIRAGLFAENVRAVCRSGGTMKGLVFQEWLAQKFPHANTEEAPSNGNGLAVAPRFYGLLDLSHQQYSDFFLVHEICKLDWREPMHPATVLQQLQQRGINVHSCVNRVISILQNNLPKGIIPQDPILVRDSRIEFFLESGGLFERLANGFYQISPKQLAWMDNYLAQLCNHLQQSITEPMVFVPQTFLAKGATIK